MGARLPRDLLDLLVPERCAVCALGEIPLCGACREALLRIRPPVCARCGAPTAWPVRRCAECAGRRIPFASARAALVYEGAARTLVAGWKERGRRGLASTLAELVVEAVARPPVEALAFVPGDRERTLWRGQNAAEALARALSERWALPVMPLLARTGRTPRQRGLARAERRANVRGAFAAAPSAPRRIALVDDVYTTGATVSAATTELRRAGARAVHVVTLARAVRR
jgi:ComF family protein